MVSCVMLGAVHTGSATILAWTACQMSSSSALWDTMAPMVLSLMAGWGGGGGGGGGGWQLSAISEVRKPNSIQVNKDCKVYILK